MDYQAELNGVSGGALSIVQDERRCFYESGSIFYSQVARKSYPEIINIFYSPRIVYKFQLDCSEYKILVAGSYSSADT